MTKIQFPFTESKEPINILRSVAKAILQEPLRYDQREWLLVDSRSPVLDDAPSGSVTLYQTEAACGTAACVFGWAVVLTRTRLNRISDITSEVTAMLGVDYHAAYQLSDSDAIDRLWRNYYDTDGYMPDIGSMEYAMLGVEHIRRWVRANFNTELGTDAEILAGDWSR